MSGGIYRQSMRSIVAARKKKAYLLKKYRKEMRNDGPVGHVNAAARTRASWMSERG